jgi:hypothetical protein
VRNQIAAVVLALAWVFIAEQLLVALLSFAGVFLTLRRDLT